MIFRIVVTKRDTLYNSHILSMVESAKVVVLARLREASDLLGGPVTNIVRVVEVPHPQLLHL